MDYSTDWPCDSAPRHRLGFAAAVHHCHRCSLIVDLIVSARLRRWNRVSKAYKVAILVVVLALSASGVVVFKTARDLQNVRNELLAVTSANEFLKKTLADMAIAITAKEKEVDRLEDAGCEGRKKASGSTEPRASAGKASKSEPPPQSPVN